MCESSLERDCCYHLEYSKDVLSFQSQPEGFYYSSGHKRYSYTPDFLVRNQDDSEYFVEVKPLDKTFSEDFKRTFVLKRITAKQ
ncbi:TnsA endonuclease N-terminal domain-containing protein [Vibrio fluvialis]|uniref:TnsA endonuclease N-terminal domain-containing protein n=1 Tax=Vibrio fluvialis TaxID=676 RepID=UPI0028F6C0D9|nr:TnsA endonuclease N-terminal domain-containing protein [Vibrio fluvialis]